MSTRLPEWAIWNSDPTRPPWTVGIEEEVMLLEPRDWSLAHRIDSLLPELSPRLVGSVSAETHACTLELATGVHATVREAAAELYALRAALADELRPLGLQPAVAGTHPLALGHEVEVSGGARYQLLHEGLRVLARREPTFALHVHVGVPDAALAIRAFDRLRAHLPLILGLSANSPFWAGRDSGMASVRTPLFQAFPRSGVPRRCDTYDTYVERLDMLLRAEAFPEPTFVWSDVRLQPRFGTVEVRVADAQTSVAEVAAIAAVIQALVRIEATEELADEALVDAQEVIEENRFLAARDGMDARLVDPVSDSRVPAAAQLATVLDACADHAVALDSRAELEVAAILARRSGAEHQRQLARTHGLEGVVPELGRAFLDPTSLVAQVAAIARS
jgi:glutamate---cysteine ligase / carboxylate-amine ligase